MLRHDLSHLLCKFSFPTKIKEVCSAYSLFFFRRYVGLRPCRWVFENHDLLALEGGSRELVEHLASRHDEKELSARKWQRLRKTLKNEYSTACEGTREDCMTRRLQQLEREMGPAQEDVVRLEIMLRSHMQPIIESLVYSVFECGRLHHRRRFFNVTSYLLPYVLGIPAALPHPLHGRCATREVWACVRR